MYGLVNQAMEDYVRRDFGDDSWGRIRAGAGLALDMFVSMDSYPDDVTYRLVDAAVPVLGLPPEQILEAFGEHWVLYTAREGYGDMLAMCGSNLRQFLARLDNLHTHVGLSFAQLRPPSFEVEPVPGEDAVLLHYRSERAGLAPMVVGLLKGLGKRFGEAVAVRRLERPAAADHDVFRIDFIGSSPPRQV